MSDINVKSSSSTTPCWRLEWWFLISNQRKIFHLAHQLRLDRRPICMLRSYYRGTLAFASSVKCREDVGRCDNSFRDISKLCDIQRLEGFLLGMVRCSWFFREKMIKWMYMINEQNPGWLGYIGDDTTQLYRDCNKPLWGSLLTNQYNGK